MAGFMSLPINSLTVNAFTIHFSASPPPLQAGTFSRGVVTMRCDVTTSSCGHISLLVSGSAQTCFDDQVIESKFYHKVSVLEMLESYAL